MSWRKEGASSVRPCATIPSLFRAPAGRRGLFWLIVEERGASWRWQLEEMTGHSASTAREQKEMELVLGWLSPFHSVQGPSPWDGGTHRSRGSSHLG